MTYEEAVLYILKHAGKEGLTHECLKGFVSDVEGHRNTSLQPDYWLLANLALLEWDI